jgi:hypothetical protein
VEHWKQPGRTVLATGYIVENPYADPLVFLDTADSIVAKWHEALSLEGLDGIIVDEFSPYYGGGPDVTQILTDARLKAWTGAIGQAHLGSPSSVLAFYINGYDAAKNKWDNYAAAERELLAAMVQYADYILPEIYYYSESDAGSGSDPFPRFRETIDRWESWFGQAILDKTVIALYADNAAQGYGQFLHRQIDLCRTDPVLRLVKGIAIYAVSKLSLAEVATVNNALHSFSDVETASGRVERVFAQDHLYFRLAGDGIMPSGYYFIPITDTPTYNTNLSLLLNAVANPNYVIDVKATAPFNTNSGNTEVSLIVLRAAQ